MSTTVIIAIFIGLVCFVLSQAAFRMMESKSAAKQRLEEMKRSSAPRFGDAAGGDDAPWNTPATEMTLEPNYSPLAVALRGLLSAVLINADRHRKEKALLYYRAGFTSPNHPIYFLAFQTFVGPFLIALSLYFFFGKEAATGLATAMNVIVGSMVLIAGLMGPRMLLKNSRAKREKKLTNSFPDMLDLLLVCVETGLALDGALARVTRELGKTAPEITEELNRTRLELSLLNDRKQALINLAQRTNLAPYKTLVGALLQSEQMGTSLTDTLRILSEDYRMRRLMDAETRAGRLPVMITIPLIVFFMPALFIIILAPF